MSQLYYLLGLYYVPILLLEKDLNIFAQEKPFFFFF
jgi:hypothetical protein